MRNIIYRMSILLIISISYVFSSEAQDLITEADLGKIMVNLKSTKSVYDMDAEIIIVFEVTNISENALKFCKRNCPLEGKFIADFFEVSDENNVVVGYTGEKFERMPPTDLEFLELGSMLKIEMPIDLQKGYKITKPGTYTVSFKGDKLNKLPDSEAITIVVQ